MARILVIDADAGLRSVAHVILRRAGHRVTLAADGDEGRQAFRADPADLVFCDSSMTGQFGATASLPNPFRSENLSESVRKALPEPGGLRIQKAP